MNTKEITNIQITNVDTKDYPDFCDAYIESAEWQDGTELTEDELDELNEDGELINELAHASLY